MVRSLSMTSMATDQHILQQQMVGAQMERQWAKLMSRWNAFTMACGDRLNTTRLGPMPRLDRVIRNT